MAPWGSLKNIFGNPLPDFLSPWAQLLPDSAETEISFDIFGEICHQVKPDPLSPTYRPPPPLPVPYSSSWNGVTSDVDENAFEIFGELCYKTKPEPVCSSQGKDVGGQGPENRTEESGVESLADADDTEVEGTNERKGGRKFIYGRSSSGARSRYINDGSFPPPITTIARCGKPRVYFKSYRQDGRFVLREIRIPTQRLLHTRREDGRLRMQVVGPMETERRGEENGGRDDEDGGE